MSNMKPLALIWYNDFYPLVKGEIHRQPPLSGERKRRKREKKERSLVESTDTSNLVYLKTKRKMILGRI